MSPYTWDLLDIAAGSSAFDMALSSRIVLDAPHSLRAQRPFQPHAHTLGRYGYPSGFI